MRTFVLSTLASVALFGAATATVQADTIPVHGYLGIAYGR